MELTYLRNILSDLQKRFDQKFSSDSFHLKRELLVLHQYDKLLIKKKVLGFDYNIGALSVLKLLKECDVLDISEYLLNKSNETEVQGIIADLIDLEDAQEMLADVIKASQSSEIINSQFQECLRQYTLDVIRRPQLIKHEFTSSIKRFLPEDVFRDLIALKFFEQVLSIDYKKVTEITDVIGTQKTWNDGLANEELRLFNKIRCQHSEHNSEDVAKLLLQHIDLQDINWFFLLAFISSIDQKSKGFDDLKNFIKTSFKKFNESKNPAFLFKTLIIARQMFHYTKDSSMPYKTWVKQTIGEMNYQLKSQPKFTQALEALQSMIFFETDVDVLEIHASTAIASPRGTNNLVLEYKQQLRTRIASLKDPDSCMDLT